MKFPDSKLIPSFLAEQEPLFSQYKHNLETLNKIINDVGEPLEGNIFYEHLDPHRTQLIEKFFPKRAALAMFAMSHDNIIEIGFNSGFSALLMLTANPNLKLTSVDICHHKYTLPCFEYLKSIFGDRIELARAYAKALARDSDTLGLLGPRELEILWSRHILNSAVVAQLVADGKTVADVGSGAGLPGIPMAIAQPNAHFTLIEPMERRSDWLKAQVQELGLTNVVVLRARAEEVGEVFDIVTARAVSNLSKLLRLTIDLIREGGELLALKGSKAAEEIAEAQKLSKKLKLAGFDLLTVGAEHLSDPTTVVRTRLI